MQLSKTILTDRKGFTKEILYNQRGKKGPARIIVIPSLVDISASRYSTSEKTESRKINISDETYNLDKVETIYHYKQL